MAEDLLKINMLGEFSLTCHGVTVSDQSRRSKKLWMLLEYLITFREKEVTQNDLVELLWPNGEIDNPINTLKTLLHRARAAVAEIGFSGGKDLVLTRCGSYVWNTAIPIWVDTDRFDADCREAAACTDEHRRLDLLLKAIDLYKGDFLPKNALEPWAVPICAYYHVQYVRIVLDALELLHAAGRYHDAISVCQRAVVIDPYEEALHKHLILALMKTGAPQAARRHYEYVTELFFNQFGVNPSKELTAVYREIAKTENGVALDLRVIKASLADCAQLPGAFFCEYEFFKDVYKLHARASARSGQTVQVALLTLTDRAGRPLDKKIMRLNMNHLKNIIAISLRRGDVYTRCSISQYLLMLPSASHENSEMVIERVVRNYRRQYPKSDVVIQRSLLPLDPVV